MSVALLVLAACAISFAVGYVTEYRNVSRRWAERDDYGRALAALAEIKKRAR